MNRRNGMDYPSNDMVTCDETQSHYKKSMIQPMKLKLKLMVRQCSQKQPQSQRQRHQQHHTRRKQNNKARIKQSNIKRIISMVVCFMTSLIYTNHPVCEAFTTHVMKKLNVIPASNGCSRVCTFRQRISYSRTTDHYQQQQQLQHHNYDYSTRSIRRGTCHHLHQMKNGYHEHNGDDKHAKHNDRKTTSIQNPQQHNELKNGNAIQKLESTIRNEVDQNTNNQKLVLSKPNNNIPKHVAFVCDGNSRWAKARNVPTFVGHAVGADRLVEILTLLKNDGISCCTMYGFSTENWRRPAQEINDVLTVMEQTANRFYDRAIKESVCVKILGDMEDERLPQSLRDILTKLEHDTMQFGPATTTARRGTDTDIEQSSSQQSLTLCLAINYGGRTDIVNASLQLAQAISNGEIDVENVSEETLSSFLCTKDIPDPDLIIRTSGECRLSNFLLWNAAYAELYFTPVLWPDFGKEHWKQALSWYGERKRRFGAREEGKQQRQSIEAT